MPIRWHHNVKTMTSKCQTNDIRMSKECLNMSKQWHQNTSGQKKRHNLIFTCQHDDIIMSKQWHQDVKTMTSRCQKNVSKCQKNVSKCQQMAENWWHLVSIFIVTRVQSTHVFREMWQKYATNMSNFRHLNFLDLFPKYHEKF